MNRKRRGELSELAFIYKATGLGFNVCKPYGDSSRFDFIVEHRGRLSKVQVKSTSQLFPSGGYYLNCQRRMKGGTFPYLPGEVDFFAAHVVPLDVWYVIPLSVIGSKFYVRFYPHLPARDTRFAPFREAWHLLESSSNHPMTQPAPSAARGLPDHPIFDVCHPEERSRGPRHSRLSPAWGGSDEGPAVSLPRAQRGDHPIPGFFLSIDACAEEPSPAAQRRQNG